MAEPTLEELSETTHRTGEDGWQEWSVNLGTQVDPDFKPRGLFVRVDGGMIDVTECRVTSKNAGARELEGDDTRRTLMLRKEEATWLVRALMTALDVIATPEECTWCRAVLEFGVSDRCHIHGTTRGMTAP